MLKARCRGNEKTVREMFDELIMAVPFTNKETRYIPKIKSALEKQIPKKPIKTPDNHKWFCPTCHNPIRLGRNHCCNCGQKIGYGSDTE